MTPEEDASIKIWSAGQHWLLDAAYRFGTGAEPLLPCEPSTALKLAALWFYERERRAGGDWSPIMHKPPDPAPPLLEAARRFGRQWHRLGGIEAGRRPSERMRRLYVTLAAAAEQYAAHVHEHGDPYLNPKAEA